MKTAKVLVLTLVLAFTGYVYASDKDQTAGKADKAAACNTEGCCKAKQDCCAPGAECCKEGAQCCDPDAGCCGDQCAKCGDNCCQAETAQAKSQCSARMNGSAKGDHKGCCGTACKKGAAAK